MFLIIIIDQTLRRIQIGRHVLAFFGQKRSQGWCLAIFVSFDGIIPLSVSSKHILPLSFPSGFMNTWNPAWFHIHLSLFRNSGINSALKHTDNVPFMIPLEILLHIRNKYYPSTCFVVTSALSVDVSCRRTHSSSLRNLYLKWPCPVLLCEIKPGLGIGRDKVSRGTRSESFRLISIH